ncbi:MAG: MoxR family ATPase [Acidobacteria bacterium]|nr:MoxR family ATPase [Acidobacteriota bacterium]
MHESLETARDLLLQVEKEAHKAIVGMDEVVRSCLICLCAGQGSHILFEGVPGVGKTQLVKTIAAAVNVEFSRIQMMPDTQPHDVTGYELLDQRTNTYHFKRGPVFASFVLCDEINRATSKTASAMLEAMQEGQVSTDFSGAFRLPEPFMVFATQNPIEQEGTYELAEAQKDRFLFKVLVNYPTHEEAIRIADLNTRTDREPIRHVLSSDDVRRIRVDIEKHVHVDADVMDRTMRLVELTRPETSDIKRVREQVRQGASPRAQIGIVRAARARAITEGRDFVTPQDVIRLALPVLRHRILFDRPARTPAGREEQFVSLVHEILDAAFAAREVTWA